MEYYAAVRGDKIVQLVKYDETNGFDLNWNKSEAEQIEDDLIHLEHRDKTREYTKLHADKYLTLAYQIYQLTLGKRD